MPWDPEFEAAIKKGDIAQVNKLMDKGADANAGREQDTDTPLSHAVRINAGPVVEAITKHDKFKYADNTNIAILYAVIFDHPEFLPFLLKKHSDKDRSVDYWKYHTETARWLAEEKGYADAVALLIEHGAEPKPTTIPEGHLQITDQKIGSGNHGTVYLGVWERRMVAVKKYTDKGEGITEAIFMSHLSHPNIVAFYGIQNTPTTLNLVMEYMDNGNLQQYLRKHPRKNETDLLIVYRILLDIAKAVTYLHENRRIHLDIRGPNILLNEQLSAKLCDFNVSKKLTPNNDVYHYTTETRIRHLTRAYDILCVGTVLNMVATEERSDEFDRFSYERDTDRLLFETAGTRMPALPAGTPTKVVSLIKWCTETEPAKRPTAAEVVEGLKAVI